jgi:hypothetical protein
MNAADTKANLSAVLDRLLNGESLTESDAYELMHRFAAGELDPALAGAFGRCESSPCTRRSRKEHRP